MSRSVRLRPWQKEALERFAVSERPDFLAVATPGAGKTTFALTAAVQDLVRHPERRVVVVAPTQHLKHQWARAAGRFDLHLEPQWAARDGRLPEDMHGIVVTYQQVAMQPKALRGVAHEAFVIFDELHHAGEDRAWGDGVREAFEGAAKRLAISGTPFRSDTAAIPFIDYDGLGEAHSDYEYGYGDALRDGGVVRPVYFPRIDGHMEWVGPDGTEYSHTFDFAMQQKKLVGTIFGSANPRYDIPRLLGLYRSGQLKLDELVTRTYPLEEINQGYQDMRDGKNIRGVIIYED